MKTNILLLMLFILATCVGCSKSSENAPAPSHDGRFGGTCNARIGHQDGTFCTISIYQLISRPERYDGQLVIVSGYLVAEQNNELFFYADAASAQRHDVSASIWLAGLTTSYFKDMPGLAPPVPLRIGARFNAKDEGPSRLRLGSFEDIKFVD